MLSVGKGPEHGLGEEGRLNMIGIEGGLFYLRHKDPKVSALCPREGCK